MTNWNILVEPTKDGQTTATVVELPAFQVTASNRQTALDEIQNLLAERLANAEMVSISVPSENDESPWLKFGGVFKDDPDFEDIVRDIRAEREGHL
ncbi:MAG: hypothetical protein ABG776_22720 [Cyanobacteria bacterium J06555_13]